MSSSSTHQFSLLPIWEEKTGDFDSFFYRRGLSPPTTILIIPGKKKGEIQLVLLHLFTGMGFCVQCLAWCDLHTPT